MPNRNTVILTIAGLSLVGIISGMGWLLSAETRKGSIGGVTLFTTSLFILGAVSRSLANSSNKEVLATTFLPSFIIELPGGELQLAYPAPQMD